ncbi:MAG: signal peptidase I [Planctomycetes bacterium]|nr:signal peptidase I [Planctomycetota bacterium]MBL7008649.1 signal peptidase I [Planctomycetota bacterium]
MPDSPIGRPPGTRLGLLNHARRAGSLLLFLSAPLLLATYRVAPVQGASMEPTLHDGQTVCYQALPNSLLMLGRGDLVVFDSPMDPGHRYVKRLVGLPGDELRFEYGLLRVNGLALGLPEGAVDSALVLSTRVPEGCFFALGDHGAVSYDSRRFGAVPLDHLVGRLIYALP